MKAVILARVSTKEQEELGHSLDAQTRRLKEYAKKHDFEVAKEFSFSESAGNKIRRKFEEVLKYLKSSKDVKVLLCENVDRVTRNFRDAVDIDDMRINHGLEIHFVQDGFFINAQATGNQMFMWEAKVFLAKQYLNRLSDDVKRSIEQKLRNGEWPERAPIGLKNIDLEDGRKDIVIDEERAPFIKKAFQLYATENYGLPQIMKILNDDGLRNSTKAGKPISKSQLSDILSNPFYYGEMLYRDKIYPHRYEKLIDRWLFEKCKDIRDGRSGIKIKYASKPYIFRGILKCATCGCLVGIDPKKGINYCVCSQYKGKHGAVRVTQENLLEQVAKAFENIKIPDDIAEDLKKEVTKMFENEQEMYEVSVEQLQKDYKKNQATVKKAWYDNNNGRITDAMYDEIFKETNEKQETIESRMKNFREADEQFKISCLFLLRLANKASEIFRSSKPERQRALITFALSNLKLDGNKLLWDYKKPFDAMALCTKNSDWLPELDSDQQPSD